MVKVPSHLNMRAWLAAQPRPSRRELPLPPRLPASPAANLGGGDDEATGAPRCACRAWGRRLDVGLCGA